MAINYPASLDGTTQFGQPSGTNLLSGPIDHAAQHDNLSSFATTAQAVLGTTAGTSVIKNFVAGNFAARVNSTNVFQDTIAGGTANAMVMGSPTLQAPTINGLGTNSGTISTGVYNTGTFGTPTINTPVASGIFSNGNIANNKTITWTNGDRQCGTMTGNGTLVFAGTATGQILTLVLYQNATGGYTLAFPTMKWPGTSAGTIGTAASSIHTLTIMCDQNSNFLAQLNQNYG